ACIAARKSLKGRCYRGYRHSHLIDAIHGPVQWETSGAGSFKRIASGPPAVGSGSKGSIYLESVTIIDVFMADGYEIRCHGGHDPTLCPCASSIRCSRYTRGFDVGSN